MGMHAYIPMKTYSFMGTLFYSMRIMGISLPMKNINCDFHGYIHLQGSLGLHSNSMDLLPVVLL